MSISKAFLRKIRHLRKKTRNKFGMQHRRVKNTFPITRKKIDALSLPQQTANEQISGESNNREGAAPRQPKEI